MNRRCAVPRYDYRCQQCGLVYEKREGFDAPSLQVCPDCSGTARRVLTPPAIVFKGSGWYSTDNRKSANGSAQGDGSAKNGEKNDENSQTTSQAKNDEKSESKTESKTGSTEGSGGESSAKPEKTTKAAAAD